jgi:trehalose synthase
VVLHDPQTLGLAPALARVGARVIWSCHIGADQPNQHTARAWRFLQPYATHTDCQVFSRPHYIWDSLDPSRVVIIPPCIDAFSAKNQSLDDGTVSAILAASALVPAAATAAPATFTRNDETPGRITARAAMLEDAPLPPRARVITQISRWDPLKDHRGVIDGFCRHVPSADDVHLVLAGPDPDSVADDPESQETLAELRAARDALEPGCRTRVHIACLPMHDVDENAAIVNALQRRADVIVQKSLAEGFGLTVAEAMWKARPTIASRVGGIQDQIEPDRSGLLVDPTDLPQFGDAVTRLLDDPDAARALGEAARTRVCRQYLAPHHLERHFRLLLDLLPAD